jgi:hypothetical protein
MKRTLIALALVAATVTACQKEEGPAAPPSAEDTTAPGRDSAARVESEAAAPANSVAPSDGVVLPSRPSPRPLGLDLPALAYAYDFSLEAPADSIPDMMRRHEQLCIDSGPTQCQVLGTDLQSEGRDEAKGRLEMRATQSWVRMFRPGLAADARDAGGELRGSGTDTEDLTQPIADTDAALKSKIEVRDRLRAMLQRPGKLDDVMQVERELQRVQAEIDAAQSSLNQLNTRVEAVRVTVAYSSVAPIVPENATRPFRGASGAFVRTFMGVLAAITWIAAVALPFVIIFGPVVWMLASRRRKATAAE